ncbi:hypothetical protein Tco_0911347 [Tanacetum coccineum]|uniref:Uncharacterized protein n=1 Tax=Tanacetum coccineum TaxID=301880 RepID=A0ABQ5CX42_9ASTR
MSWEGGGGGSLFKISSRHKEFHLWILYKLDQLQMKSGHLLEQGFDIASSLRGKISVPERSESWRQKVIQEERDLSRQKRHEINARTKNGQYALHVVIPVNSHGSTKSARVSSFLAFTFRLSSFLRDGKKWIVALGTRLMLILFVDNHPELVDLLGDVSDAPSCSDVLAADAATNNESKDDTFSNALIAEMEADMYGLQLLLDMVWSGSGTYATVYHGRCHVSDLAIKRINKSFFAGRASEEEWLMNDFWREHQVNKTKGLGAMDSLLSTYTTRPSLGKLFGRCFGYRLHS